jgi:hypothetical protein
MTNYKQIIANIISLLVFVPAMIILLIVGFWMVYPYRTIEFKGDKFPIVDKIATQGGKLRFVSDYCRYTSEPVEITRSFVNGIVLSTPITTSLIKNILPSGCHKKTISIPVPPELPIGKMHLRNLYVIKVNPIRTISFTRESEEFNIVYSYK